MLQPDNHSPLVQLSSERQASSTKTAREADGRLRGRIQVGVLPPENAKDLLSHPDANSITSGYSCQHVLGDVVRM